MGEAQGAGGVGRCGGFDALDDGGEVEVGGEADQGPGEGVPDAGARGLGDGASSLMPLMGRRRTCSMEEKPVPKS